MDKGWKSRRTNKKKLGDQNFKSKNFKNLVSQFKNKKNFARSFNPKFLKNLVSTLDDEATRKSSQNVLNIFQEKFIIF